MPVKAWLWLSGNQLFAQQFNDRIERWCLKLVLLKEGLPLLAFLRIFTKDM
jgi:hypothetical protein